jgi:hypothetical protein
MGIGNFELEWLVFEYFEPKLLLLDHLVVD